MTGQILIADDSQAVRKFIARALVDAGYDVTQASDGAGVLVRLAFPPPSLVILDLHMPILSGIEVLRRLREVPAWTRTPVIFLTASEQIEHMVEARQLNARGYLVKPITVERLTASIDRVLRDPDLIWLDDLTEVRSR